ncbi:response regulator transcription factor [Acaryochloris marina NIES-2412]|uniref:response regulator transcription factor n=1 Tax=Acaryochloris marina TaxID=155978 RepID=UPI004059D326
MDSLHILIVEANPHLRSLLGWHLQQVGYFIHLSASIKQAQAAYQQHQPDLVIVDSELPDGLGQELCRWLQRQKHPLILMLSAQTTEADVVSGLKAGADDYVGKPFGMQEFLARISALSRRSRLSLPTQISFGALRIDLIQRRVHYHNELVDLTPQEFSLLYVLVQAEGAALSRVELLQRAWPESIDNPRTVDTHILSLRKKIEQDPQQPQLIQTVRNVGYRLNLSYLMDVNPSRRSDTSQVPPSSNRFVADGATTSQMPIPRAQSG